jgi:signal-transduction protein with cAMP-binding, CBS, and nucleotidyltransferase domain
MHRDRIHRVWVTERGALVGVVSTFDLLPLLAKATL